MSCHAPGSKRRYPCTQTASAVQKYFPRLLQFCTSYRIWHASRAWKWTTARNLDFHTAKNIQLQANSFSLFLDEPYKLTSDLFTVVWPASLSWRTVCHQSRLEVKGTGPLKQFSSNSWQRSKFLKKEKSTTTTTNQEPFVWKCLLDFIFNF